VKETSEVDIGNFVSVVAPSGDVICVAKKDMGEGRGYLRPVAVFV